MATTEPQLAILSNIARQSLARGLLVGLCLFGLAPLSVAEEAAAGTLRDQLRMLAATHGFQVSRLSRLGLEPAVETAGDVQEQLEAMLAGYNYVVLTRADGQIERVLILGSNFAGLEPTDTFTVRTMKHGLHHVVHAELMGPSQVGRQVSLMVDTGATTVVLPASMIEPLGFDREELRTVWTQTANGPAEVKRGTLSSVELGRAKVEEVLVTFVDDERLGDTALLGMSFLERFQVTLDDSENQIILMEK